jgi:hypothetical protein
MIRTGRGALPTGPMQRSKLRSRVANGSADYLIAHPQPRVMGPGRSLRIPQHHPQQRTLPVFQQRCALVKTQPPTGWVPRPQRAPICTLDFVAIADLTNVRDKGHVLRDQAGRKSLQRQTCAYWLIFDVERLVPLINSAGSTELEEIRSQCCIHVRAIAAILLSPQ